MITYDWNCKKVDVYLQKKGKTNVVYNVHWIVTGTKKDYSVNNIGTQIIKLDPETSFIPFDQLTNEIVIDWTKNAIGADKVQTIEDSIASKIAELENPTSVTMTIGE